MFTNFVRQVMNNLVITMDISEPIRKMKMERTMTRLITRLLLQILFVIIFTNIILESAEFQFTRRYKARILEGGQYCIVFKGMARLNFY